MADTPTPAEQLLEAWNSHDPEQVIRQLGENHTYEDVALQVINHGRAETRTFFEGAYHAFPDLHFQLTGANSSSQQSVFEWTMTGTHRGDMPGLPATGKPFAVRGATVIDTLEGKIQAVRDYWDLTTLLRQVGLMPEPTNT